MPERTITDWAFDEEASGLLAERKLEAGLDPSEPWPVSPPGERSDAGE